MSENTGHAGTPYLYILLAGKPVSRIHGPDASGMEMFHLTKMFLELLWYLLDRV